MTDWIQKYSQARCGTKQAFRKASKADDAAMKASLKTGELIVSYQCYDCGRWHIGHADEAQLLARKPEYPSCIICGKPISKKRRRRAGASTQVCSSACGKKKRNRAYKKRRAARQQQEELNSESSE